MCTTFLNLFQHGTTVLHPMPILGLGTWNAKEDKEIEQALNTALETGYRHIDTAYVYHNEAAIGRVLKEWISSGKVQRKDLFITTKLPMVGVHPDRVEMFMKKSLENLQLDYVDLYLIHFPVGCKYKEGELRPYVNEKGETATEGPTDHEAVWKKMEEQVKAGRTKTIGLSNYNIAQIERVLKSAEIRPANLQVELHVHLQQRQLVDFCHKNNITVVAYSPLGSPGFNKFLKQLGKEEKKLPDILGDPVISEIAQKHRKSPAQVALRFLIQRNIAVIPKSVTSKRIKENFGVFNFLLDENDMDRLSKLDVGEQARIADFLLFPGISNHPDYPFKA